MTDLQLGLLCATIVAVLYQVVQVVQVVRVGAIVSHYGSVKIKWTLWLAIWITIGIEIAFVLAMTGRI
jgi:hypothetical protein